MAMGMQGLLARAGHLWLGCVGSEQCAGGRGCCRPVGTSLALPCAGGLVLESKCLVPCDGLRAFGARACRFGGWDQGQALGFVHMELCSILEHKALFVTPPPGSWAGSAQRCRVCAVFGVPVGGNVVFSIQSCWSGRAEGGCVRRAGRDGHTAVLCSSPWGWMTCCAAPWAGLTALGTFGALPEPRVHQSSGAPLLHGH